MKVILNCVLTILLFFGLQQSIVMAPGVEIEEEIPPVEVEIEEIKGIVNELHILHPSFRNKVIKLLYECKKQGITLKVIETYRPPERQDSLKRRKLSQLSGGCSKHQHFIAVDVVPIINGKAIWHNRKLWNKIGLIGEAQGLIWGGRWRSIYDPGHFEYKCSIDSVENIPLPDTVIIPLDY